MAGKVTTFGIRMQKLSAVIITYNEARNIARCIASLKGVADEIVVVDSFSTDATPEICKELGVRFYQTEWQGYSIQKNYGNSLATNDLILSIDADEALSDELRQSIIEAKINIDGSCSFNRLTDYCGKWIRHSGWYPDTKVRLFNRNRAEWVGTVHERLTVDAGPVKHLKGDLLHYSYHTVAEHVVQTDHYSTLGAEELFRKGARRSLLKLLFNPWLKFNRLYFIRLGFLDGIAGLTIALISAYGTYLKYVKLHYLVKHSG